MTKTWIPLLAVALWTTHSALAVPLNWTGDEEGTGSIPASACSNACVCNCPGGETVPAEPKPAPSRAPLEAEPNTSYPVSFLERPLILPPDLSQVSLQLKVLRNANDPGSNTTERIGFGFDTQLADRFQAGAQLELSTDPRVDLFIADVNFQYSVNPYMNARLDAGLRKLRCVATGGGVDYAYSGGLGLPIKYPFKFAGRLAAISGSPFSYGYSDDLFTWDVKGCGSVGTLGLPIGLMASFGESVMAAVRTGYRHLYGNGASADFFPFAVDLAVSPGQQSDVGVTLELPDGPSSPTQSAAQESYLFEKRITVWAQTRL